MTDDVLISVEHGVGRVRLNRPKAIHALTTQMCEAMSQALLRWRSDSNVEVVLIDHAEGRGFCAGGDVVMIARSGDSDAEEAKRFFWAEYRLNHLLFTYPKPTVAIMDGITMGGGVGISLPCTYRIATENTRFAMPETSIAPTSTTVKGPSALSKWQTSRSLRAKRRGIAATANGSTPKSRPGTCTVWTSSPASGMCTR